MPLHPDFAAELRRQIAGDIRLDPASRTLYSTDASIYQIEPLGVVIPRTQEDLHAIVELAAKYRVPLVPRGAGTSLAGQAIGEGMVVDCSRWLDRILEIDPHRRLARIEPGVILANLNQASARWHLEFGPDPASAERATMGGVVANNASGAHSVLHGMTADHLVSANVLLADGERASFGPVVEETAQGESSRPHHQPAPTRYEALVAAAMEIRSRHAQAIRERFPRTWRNSAGYRINYLLPWAAASPPGWPEPDYPARSDGAAFNLAHLLAGSEGTLAIIQDVTVNLVSSPAHTILGIISYQDEAAACDAVPGLLRLSPSAIELIPRVILHAAQRIPGYASQVRWLQGDPTAILVVELAGKEPNVLRQRLADLGAGVQMAVTPEEQAMVWGTRKAGLGLLNSMPRSARPTAFVEDCAIPVEHLGEFVREMQRVMDEHDARGGIYGHASAGCLHTRPVLDLTSGRGVHALRAIAEATLELAMRYGGAMSSEHGDGIARGEWLRRTYGEDLSRAMLGLKHAADPHGILNPGKMLEAPPMDSNLRYGPGYRGRAWETPMDFAARGGLTMAIEQCNGQGVCRKESGVMCPSFQATREEMHSTRGRANLLRALISTGWRQLDGNERRELSLDREARRSRRQAANAVHAALELCLGCRGCAAECPSGVDMARLKSTFLEQRYRSRLRPLRDYVFGYFGDTARLLAAAGPLVDAALRFPPVRRMGSKLMGITTRRPLPRFAASPRRAAGARGAASVLLLRDPFSHFVDNGVERAAAALLASAGLRVQVLRSVSAGAAMISKGFLGSARRHAEKLLDELNRVDPGGDLPIIVLEPSELSAIRHEFRELVTGDYAAAAARFSAAQSAEEFLVGSDALVSQQPLAGAQRVLFHPHCHEKAESRAGDFNGGDTYAGMHLLRQCGYEVKLIDAGCCGMGGTFGYDAEHYEISQKIGGLKLFPEITAGGDALVAATGGSCRLQIVQGTGRAAEHPVVLAARALGLD